MAYSELVKNFEKVRAYMREFYLYGFKTRSEYSAKSARSYDDERRRIESWLGDYMRFSKSGEGKSVFLSVDSRVTKSNPFYKAWKAKSFTDGDITLHFILFDILSGDDVRLTLPEIIGGIDERLSAFSEPMSFDESTVRKKLKEYTDEGIVRTERDGRRVLYSRAPDTDISELSDALDFFSEVAPCGVIGSFLLDKGEAHTSIFGFKHHYITGAIDSDISAQLFDAMRRKCYVSADNIVKNSSEAKKIKILPLKIYISAQNGRQNLLAYHPETNRLNSYRLDYLANVKTLDEECPDFDMLRRALAKAEEHMWGVNCRWSLSSLEHVEFDVYVGAGEEYIVKRLLRERRCGKIEMLDGEHYRFTAEVFDTVELLPWIRSFISRITRMRFSNRTVENIFKDDIKRMCSMYGTEEADI